MTAGERDEFMKEELSDGRFAEMGELVISFTFEFLHILTATC